MENSRSQSAKATPIPRGLRPLQFRQTTKKPRNRIRIRAEDIKALKNYLALKDKLEKKYFPKIRLMFR